MGSPFSLLVCNAYIKNFGEKALSTAPYPPKCWYRYVDDTLCCISRKHAGVYKLPQLHRSQHSIYHQKRENRALEFLDTCVLRQEEGFLKTTHTDQYLNWESNHPVEHKLSVARSLMHRADTIVSDKSDHD